MNQEQIEPEVLTSTNLPAEDTIAQLRAHRPRNGEQFADFLTANWPAGVPEQCAAEDVGTDCIELKLQEEAYCEACTTYARICREWYALPDIRRRLEIAS